ncbi:MAG: cytochrome b/b6 domain-containing protein, partial [Dokdonella sp.]
LAGRSKRQLGHNPAAAAMMLALLIGVALVGITGWLQITDRFFGIGWMEEVHEVLAYGVLVMVGLHVVAAISESIHYRENLIVSMITGRKRALEEASVERDDAA